MKKSILITAIAILALTGLGASAQNYDRRGEYRGRERYSDRSGYRQLRAELYQLNIMFARVNAHLGTYGGGRHIRSDYSRLLRDRDRLNYELQRRPLDRLRLQAQIDRVRDQLREIEVRLRFRGGRHYRGR